MTGGAEKRRRGARAARRCARARTRSRGLGWLLWLGAAALSVAARAQAQPAPLLDEDGRIGPGWRVAGLPAQKAPLTRFVPQRADGRDAVRLQADASYGNLVLDLPGRAAPRRLRWSWRIEEPNRAADLATKAGDDAAAKVCLAFDLPLERVPFIERQLLRMARSRSGEALPAATLCWAWGHVETPGALIANPYSRRVRTIVLRSAADGTGRWLDEERDVAADFQRAFGDEAAAPPPLVALIVGADADNTGARSAALVAGLRFAP